MIGLGLAPLKQEGDVAAGYDENAIVVSAPTWREMVLKAIENAEGSSSHIVCGTGGFDKVAAYDFVEKVSWTLWTEKRVYFPAGYDGTFWVASAPRNPSDERVMLVGGGC